MVASLVANAPRGYHHESNTVDVPLPNLTFAEQAAIDSPVVKGLSNAQSTESNNSMSAALNELELKITQIVEEFRALLKKALDDQVRPHFLKMLKRL